MDLRNLLSALEQNGQLKKVKKSVSPRFEMSGIIKKTKGEIPVLFEAIQGYQCPLVCGIGGTRTDMAKSMGIQPGNLIPHLTNAIVHPIPTTRVQSGPVHENVVMAPFSLEQYFPLLTYNEKDSAPYMVSGIMTAKDRNGKKLYTSIRRMQYLGGNRSNILITSHEMKEQFKAYETERKPMDVAIMFGVVPAVTLGSQISTYLYHANKLDVSGALLGKSLEVVGCKTIDMEVLAHAEVVLEGKVMAWIKETEGPFGEMAGYYGQVSPQPVVEFTALTYRNNPIFQTILPSSSEEVLPMALAREVVLYNTVRQTVPALKQVHITLGGVGRYHAIIQVAKSAPSDGKQAALAAFASDKDLKHVVVVDEDIDIFNPKDVEWALATRVQGDSDIFIVPGAAGSPLEASHHLKGVTAKVGIDATKPMGDTRFDRTYIPGEENIQLDYYLE